MNRLKLKELRQKRGISQLKLAMDLNLNKTVSVGMKTESEKLIIKH